MRDDLGVKLKLRRKVVRNPILQKHVFKVFSKELKLLLDCETRWNLIVLMLERLLKLECFIKKALDDLELNSEFDFPQLEEMLKVCTIK
jgi:hypothetical protein